MSPYLCYAILYLFHWVHQLLYAGMALLGCGCSAPPPDILIESIVRSTSNRRNCSLVLGSGVTINLLDRVRTAAAFLGATGWDSLIDGALDQAIGKLGIQGHPQLAGTAEARLAALTGAAEFIAGVPALALRGQFILALQAQLQESALTLCEVQLCLGLILQLPTVGSTSAVCHTASMCSSYVPSAPQVDLDCDTAAGLRALQFLVMWIVTTNYDSFAVNVLQRPAEVHIPEPAGAMGHMSNSLSNVYHLHGIAGRTGPEAPILLPNHDYKDATDLFLQVSQITTLTCSMLLSSMHFCELWSALWS